MLPGAASTSSCCRTPRAARPRGGSSSKNGSLIVEYLGFLVNLARFGANLSENERKMSEYEQIMIEK
jgi:hypothetical protein